MSSVRIVFPNLLEHKYHSGSVLKIPISKSHLRATESESPGYSPGSCLPSTSYDLYDWISATNTELGHTDFWIGKCHMQIKNASRKLEI